MDDYIKRKDAMLMRFTDGINEDGIVYVPLRDVFKHLKNLPAAEVRANVRGQNLEADYPSLFECSVCGWSCNDTYCGDTTTYNFCPNCGAEMREVKDEN